MVEKESYAYPFIVQADDFYHGGLTKRELFAAMAMQGLCTNTSIINEETIYIHAVKIANMLIEELNK